MRDNEIFGLLAALTLYLNFKAYRMTLKKWKKLKKLQKKEN